MDDKFNDSDIKNCTYCFFNDRINIKIFDPNEMKADENSYKLIPIYYVRWVTFKDFIYLKINSVSQLYLVIGKINRYFEEISGS